MASLNELINLSQYQSGDVGRSNLPVIRRATFQEKQSNALKLQDLALQIERRKAEAAIAKKQQELWENIGNTQNNDKTTSGITTNVVDKEKAGGRDIMTVGSSEKPEAESGYEADDDVFAMDSSNSDYEAVISKDGKMRLKGKEKKTYDRVKVVNRAMKIIDASLAENGISKSTMKASDYSARLKKVIPQAEMDLYGESTTPAPEEPAKAPEYNTITHNDMIQGALDEPKRFITSLGGAKDFYFGSKDKKAASGSKASGVKVMIETPDGKRGYIPQANLQKAIQRGAKLVQ